MTLSRLATAMSASTLTVASGILFLMIPKLVSMRESKFRAPETTSDPTIDVRFLNVCCSSPTSFIEGDDDVNDISLLNKFGELRWVGSEIKNHIEIVLITN